MEASSTLAAQWIERLNGQAVDLGYELDRFPELTQATVPANFELAVEEDSVLEAVGSDLRCDLNGRLIPSGVAASALPPTAGAIGVAFDTAEGRSEIHTLEMPTEIQGRGLGRLIIAGIVHLADDLGLGAVIVEAARTGRYAWARCGFNFMFPDQDRPTVLSAASDFARAMDVECDLDLIEQPWQLAALPGQVPASAIEDAGGPRVQAGHEDALVNLGRALLLGPPENATHWYGQLDPRSGTPDRVRLDAYAESV